MNGRLENSLQIHKKIENEIQNLPEFVLEWYFYLKANKKSATTCLDYVRKVRLFLSTINGDIINIKPDDIKSSHVTKYFIDIQTKSVVVNGKETIEYTSDSYRQTVWSCLNNLFDFLVRQGYIEYNHIKRSKIERPKNKDLARINRNRVLLDDDDFRDIIEAVRNGAGSNKAKGYQYRYRNRDLCMLNIFMSTGIRKGALRAINIEDIDMEKRTLTVVDKGDIIHEYGLSQMTIDFINAWLKDRYWLSGHDTNALFVSKEGNRISQNGIDKIVAKYSQEALGHKISPHKLRSGFISIVQSKTHDIEFARRAAGHANVTTTQRYIVTDNTESLQASEMIADILD